MTLDVQDLLLTWAEGREPEYLQLLAHPSHLQHRRAIVIEDETQLRVEQCMPMLLLSL